MMGLASRAVEKPVNPGQNWECAGGCGQRVQFRARNRMKAIICNVYVGDRWDRVEVFHPNCYGEANSPYGPVDRSKSNAVLR